MKDIIEITTILSFILTGFSLVGLVVHFGCDERRPEIVSYLIRGICVLTASLCLLPFVS